MQTKPTFTEIYEKQFTLIHNYINRRVNKSVDTDDLTQTVFEKFYLKFNDYELASLIESAKILYSIASNLVIDIYRQKTVYTSTIDELSEKGIEIPSKDTYKDSDVFKQFYKALSNVNTQTKAILYMFFIEGYSQKEIAFKIDMNINTIKTVINRNKKELQKSLQNYI